MQKSIKTVSATVAVAAAASTLAMAAPAVSAQTYPPTLSMRSMLELSINQNGHIGLEDQNVIFSPSGMIGGTINMMRDGETVRDWVFFERNNSNGAVFTQLRPENLSFIDGAAPGTYTILYSVAGQPASEFSFDVSVSASDDPFSNTRSETHFSGPWQQWAYFDFDGANDNVQLTFWAGGNDVMGQADRTPVIIQILRDGELIGGTNRYQTFTLSSHNWMGRHRAPMTQVWDGRSPSEPNLTRADLNVPGQYEVRMVNKDTDDVLRTYRFQSNGSGIVPHPRTELGYQPSTQYVAPRVFRVGSQNFEFEEAVWIEAE